MVVSYLPVGSEQAAKHYAQAALDAGVAFVNCMPVFIASDQAWARKFAEAGLPIVGDDIKSQVGATIVHRVLAKLFEDRGVKLNRTYQLNFGGNMDFMNMLERERLTSKKISKTQSVQCQLREKLDKENIHIGPSDHVPWLEDRKWAQIRLEGQAFGDVPLNVELKLEVWDSPELGRHRDRRAPVREARAGPRRRRPADRPERLLHEVAPGAVLRRGRPRDGRAVHPRQRREQGRRLDRVLRHRARRGVAARHHLVRSPPSSATEEESMRATRSNPDTVAAPMGTYSQAVRVETGDAVWIHVSGQIAIDREGNLVGPGDMRAQTRQVFENLKAILEANGATFADAVKIGTYLTTLDDLAGMREVRSEYLTSEPPASTAVQVVALVVPEALIEIDLVAVVPA